MEKIEGPNGLVNKEVLTVLGKVGIGATADGNKVRPEGLDCSFGFVQTVVTRGCQLVVEAVLFDGGDKVVGDFII